MVIKAAVQLKNIDNLGQLWHIQGMITLELSKDGWNTRYLQYNPALYAVEIEANGDMMNVMARNLSDFYGSIGSFHRVSVRTSPVPDYVSKSDIEIWN